MTHYHDTLPDRDRIRVNAQLKHEKLKAEAIDILIDALHLQMSDGATVSFDHNLAGRIEKFISGAMPRAKIIAQVRLGSIPCFYCAASKDTLQTGRFKF